MREGKRGNCPPPKGLKNSNFFLKNGKFSYQRRGLRPTPLFFGVNTCNLAKFDLKKYFQTCFLTLLKILIFLKFLPLPKFWSGYAHNHNNTFFHNTVLQLAANNTVLQLSLVSTSLAFGDLTET